MTSDRREFLRGALAAAAATAGGASASCSSGEETARGAGDAAASPVVDAHVHLFGSGDAGSGCFLSPQQRERLDTVFLIKLLGLGDGENLDERFVEVLLAQLRGSPVTRAVLFAHDGRCDRDGRLDRDATHTYVPNDWLFAVCARAPDRLVPCASVNPARRSALAELERCRARGARAVKVHPPVMCVDPGDPAFVPYWRKARELGLVVVVHTGGENATPVHAANPAWSDPARLEPALREGCTVVAAHGGFGSFLDGIDFFPSLQRLVRAHERLFLDTAVLGSMFRWRALPRLLEDDVVLGRTLHASDWPFPSNPAVFFRRLRPGTLASVGNERNLFTRDLLLKRALGLPDACAARGAAVFGA